ncbi:ATPase family AAA domain-containing protein 2-like [Eudromia elegans]
MTLLWNGSRPIHVFPRNAPKELSRIVDDALGKEGKVEHYTQFSPRKFDSQGFQALHKVMGMAFMLEKRKGGNVVTLRTAGNLGDVDHERNKGAYVFANAALHKVMGMAFMLEKRKGGNVVTLRTAGNLGDVDHERNKGAYVFANANLPTNFRNDDLKGIHKDRMKSGASLLDATSMPIDTAVRFDGVGGLSEHIAALKEMVILPLLYPEVFEKLQVQPPRGCLFYGPPGTGKTLVARALANECSQGARKISFFLRKGADALSKWLGESERQLRLLFEQAHQSRPSIIFFDEIDGLAPVRSSRQDQTYSSIVSTLLALMDGLDSRGEVVVIGATNRLDSIDPALRRPGRFDREFLFRLPDKEARKEIFKIHTRNWTPKPLDTLLEELAEKSVGYCGADIKAACAEAALRALRRRYPQIYKSTEKLQLHASSIKITAKDFVRAMEKMVPASQRSVSSPVQALSPILKPLLKKTLKRILQALQRVFPHAELVLKKDQAPSIIYIPQINVWWESAGVALKTTFTTLLENIPPFAPVLLFATSNVPYMDLQDEVQELFIEDYGEVFHTRLPTKEERRNFFEDLILNQAAKPPVSRKEAAWQALEVLPLAPPPEPRKPTQEEMQQIEEQEEESLRELRIFLRDVTHRLTTDRRFKAFTKPVDLDEVPDYTTVIKQPMDLSTIASKIDLHQYLTAGDFLKDIDLICSNALEYNPDREPGDHLIRHRACSLRDVAYAIVKAEMDQHLEQLCKEIKEARKKRGVSKIGGIVLSKTGLWENVGFLWVAKACMKCLRTSRAFSPVWQELNKAPENVSIEECTYFNVPNSA